MCVYIKEEGLRFRGVYFLLSNAFLLCGTVHIHLVLSDLRN
jgi:hypothetical protein